MGTVGRINAGIATDLIERCADVHLKEGRPLAGSMAGKSGLEVTNRDPITLKLLWTSPFSSPRL